MNYYKEIKNELINNEITKKVKDYSKNKSDLNTYYEVGRLLSEAGKHYGEGIIKEYSKKLTSELGKGYSERNLRNFRQFYIISAKWQTVSAKLTWSHYIELLPYNDINKINYYIYQVETYMVYIDKNIKRIDQDKTIGIIIVKKDNKYILEYCSDKRIKSREYELK